ncbi:MAG: hypothetical protein HWE11_16530 [Gammaproteobacteria bacterium]|nr:hypothetical protein [Gammaproteobacteria bacterium]
MTLKLKLIGLLVVIGLFIVGVSWFSHQSSLQQTRDAQNRLITQTKNQTANIFALYFEQFKERNRTLLDTSAFTQALSNGQAQKLVDTQSRLFGNENEFAVYDIENNQLYTANQKPTMGEFLGLESLILEQLKAPSNKLQLLKFRGEYALVFSNPALIEQKSHSVIFNILKLNKTFLEQLKIQTGADFQLTIKGEVISSDASLDYKNGFSLPWPINASVKGDIRYVLPNWIAEPIDQTSSIVQLASIGILLFILLLVSFLLLNRQDRQISKFNRSFTDSRQPREVINALSETEPPAELRDARNKMVELLNQQQLAYKKIQLNAKTCEQRLKELKNEKASLQIERDTAMSAPKTKSEFLSRMGDEITTPMKTLSSMLHLLSEYNLSEEPKELLNISRRSANTLINNLNNILDFSKLDANLLKLHRDNFEVRQLVDEIVAEFTPHAKSKSLELSATVAGEVPETAYNDSRRVKQILKNLLGNAVRFTKEGQVNLYCDIVMESNQEFLRFTISDSGVGIPEDAIRGLFDSLEQKTKLTNSSFAGRLRLIVSKKLSELMGGAIGVTSELQKGSRFWFTIAMHKE